MQDFGLPQLPVQPRPELALEFDFRLSPADALLYDGDGKFLGTFHPWDTPPLETRRAVLSVEAYFSIMHQSRI